MSFSRPPFPRASLSRRGLAVFVWMVFAGAWAGNVRAQNAPTALTSPTASGVKAAFLYKFLNYVELPATLFAQADSPLVIGVVGADDVHAELAQILPGRSVNQRPLHSRRLVDAQGVPEVHLLYLGPQTELARSPFVSAAKSAHVLLVTDAPDGLSAGAMINFVMVGPRVRFEVSLDTAERASIKISSRVLGVAERVVSARP